MTAFVAISCSVGEHNALLEKQEPELREIVITADLESEPETRTSLVDYSKVYWTPGDEIMLFSGGESARFTSITAEPSQSAIFKGLIHSISGVNDDSADSYNYGLYPYDEEAGYSGGVVTTTLPDKQTGLAGSFDNNLLITMGRSRSFKIGFHHVCSGIRFSLTKDGIRSVTISANGGEALAGTISAEFDEKGNPVITGVSNPSSSITVSAPDGGTFVAGESYYIITLPVRFSEGMTFSVSTGSATGVLRTSVAFSLAQGSFSRLLEVDKNISMELSDPELSVPFCLEAIDDGTITVSNPLGLSFEISKDLESWESNNSATIEVGVHPGDHVYIRGDNANARWYQNDNEYTHISNTGRCYVYGNILSLIYPENYPFETVLRGRFNYLFSNNENILSHPDKRLMLPAVKLTTSYSYSNMFEGCTSITEAPDLPATELSWHCYRFMFKNCSNLVNAPDLLPATTLADGCYSGMFSGCANLENAPELPALTLAGQNCYGWMFSFCTKLTSAPELPATELFNSCYNYMFEGCASLVNPPTLLPATELKYGCYSGMFYGCSSLETAPDLPAENLVYQCYNSMFYNCSSLNHITMQAKDGLASYRCMFNWVNGVSESGTFIKNPDAGWDITGVSGVPAGWLVVSGENQDEREPESTPLTVEAMANGNANISNPFGITIEYRLNGDVWRSFSTSAYSIPLKTGDHLSFRGNNPQYSNGSDYTNIIFSAPCYLYGNTMSLVDSQNYESLFELSEGYYNFARLFEGNDYLDIHPEKDLILPLNTTTDCYYRMFADCKGLTSAPTLPATILDYECYEEMFSGCSSLVNAPEMSATTMGVHSCMGMFSGCTSLLNAPALPAVKLEHNCYFEMFSGCSSLVTPPELPATKLYVGCYAYMFSGCTSLTTAPNLPAIKLEAQCYESMFAGCTSLTNAPALPAEELGNGCYEALFSGCANLISPPALPATILKDRCYRSMFAGCTSLSSAPALPALELAEICYAEMFSGCTNLISPPALPATIIKDRCYGCYRNMFDGCTSLSSAPALPAVELAESCYAYLFSGCTSLTTAPDLPATVLKSYCYSEMFSGCTALTKAPELPARHLVSGCYSRMFENCSSLNEVKMMALDPFESGCLENWMIGCPENGLFLKNSEATWNVTGESGIPEGWTVMSVDE